MKNLVFTLSLIIVPTTALALDGAIGVRAGVGTDVGLGLAVGVGGSYAFPAGGDLTVEIGPDFFYHNSTETSEEYGNTYHEEFWLNVFSVRANALYGYHPYELCGYVVAGVGVAAVAWEWEERSSDDPTANDGDDGTTAATMLNLGAGYNFAGFDIRAEIPILIIFGAFGETRAVPTFTLMAGYRF